MVSMANLNIPERAVRHQIVSAIHAVIQVARLSDGTRRVIAISEVSGMEGDIISLQDIFVFERRGMDENGRVRGTFTPSGIRPMFAERLAATGYRLRPGLFEARMEV
jgi:pilus assembly protein CpaF